MLLLSGQHSYPLLHESPIQISPGKDPIRVWSRRTARRGKDLPEFELIQTGVFDEDRYFDVFVEYAKADAGRYPNSHYRR